MARIIEVASLIHKEPRQWTRPRLALRLEVDIATIQRDIDLLRDMGIEIMPRGKQGYETGYKTTMGKRDKHTRVDTEMKDRNERGVKVSRRQYLASDTLGVSGYLDLIEERI